MQTQGLHPGCLAPDLCFHPLPCTLDVMVFFLEAPASSRVVPFSLFQAVSCLLKYMCLVSNHRLLGSLKSEKQESFFPEDCKDCVPSFQGQVQRLMPLVLQMTCFT